MEPKVSSGWETRDPAANPVTRRPAQRTRIPWMSCAYQKGSTSYTPALQKRHILHGNPFLGQNVLSKICPHLMQERCSSFHPFCTLLKLRLSLRVRPTPFSHPSAFKIQNSS